MFFYFMQEISSSMRGKYDRPYSVQTFLNWHGRNRISNEVFIEKMLGSLRNDCDRSEEEEQILSQINRFDCPRLKRDFLSELLDAIADPDCSQLLRAALNNVQEEEEREPVHRQDILQLAHAGDYPYWALKLLIEHDWGKDLAHFLPLVISDPTSFPSPQKAGDDIREWSYRILFRETDEMEIRVYDRDSMDYKSEIVSFEPFRDSQGLFSSSSEETITLRRRDFILDLLVDDEDLVEFYKEQINDLSDDMKLTLAVTIYWIHKANPSSEMKKAMVVLLTLMQLEARNPDAASQVGMLLATIKRMCMGMQVEVDTQMLQWASEWEVIMDEANNLNQILMMPLPEPALGRFFSGSVLEDLFTIICRNEDGLSTILKQVNMFDNLLAVTSSILKQ